MSAKSETLWRSNVRTVGELIATLTDVDPDTPVEMDDQPDGLIVNRTWDISAGDAIQFTNREESPA